MQSQILNTDQKSLLPFLGEFSTDFYLVGGTAIALYLGHRQSIDFDLFTDTTFDPLRIRNKIMKQYSITHTFSQGEGELTVLVKNVKITFFHYPFPIKRNISLNNIIKLPDLVTLGAMKAFAVGQRAKWKDYVDLYFILKQTSLSDLIGVTNTIFKDQFNEKLFRAQLSYFEDIDYTEQVIYMKEFEKPDAEIKKYLEEISITK